jgi:hypothetical protein
MNVDERLRAAGKALRESSLTQVDVALGLREIQHTSRSAGGDLVEPPPEPTGAVAAPDRLPARWLRRPQRVALAVNLLLVLVIGVLLVRVATYDRGIPDTTAAPPSSSPASQTTVVASTPKVVTKVTVPDACIESAELADEVISRLNRNVRDQRLFSALRDYTIASQACRRAAAS